MILPARNERSTIDAALRALSEQAVDRPWEVIVVDNGSTDGTAEVASKWTQALPMLRILEEARPGRHRACDTGASNARYEHLLFVDADDAVTDGYIQTMTLALDSADLACAYLDQHSLNEDAAGAVSSGFQPVNLEPQFGFLPFASGGALGIRRSVYLAIGGFGELSYAEDVDLSWRAQLAGHRMVSVPRAILRVRQRPEAASMFRQHRNYARARPLLYKHYREHGMPRRPRSEITADWLAVVRGALVHKTPEERLRWIRRAGRAVGFIEGSIKHRVLYL